MNYQESLKYIEDTHKFGIRLGLDSTGKLLELLGNPQENLKVVHVAGTNGKGSVCSFVANILKEETQRKAASAIWGKRFMLLRLQCC